MEFSTKFRTQYITSLEPAWCNCSRKLEANLRHTYILRQTAYSSHWELHMNAFDIKMLVKSDTETSVNHHHVHF